MSRFARYGRVYFIEEPVFGDKGPDLLTVKCPRTDVCVVTPRLPSDQDRNGVINKLLTAFFLAEDVQKPVVWFYTPMALEFFPKSLSPSAIVYDCMDELSMFQGAPKQIHNLEAELIGKADLMFTGGVSLFEAKRGLHSRIHPFPSGVDVSHFLQARNQKEDFREQRIMARPRLGYAGVIDERLNLGLIDDLARKRPEWQIVMIGPTAKVSPDSLPRRANIHWLGMRDYADLPKYFGGWDVGIMPFALNDATRFISPTKTPEYLAAGLPVVSTAIRDVVRPYGDLGLVRIAHSSDEFIAAAEHSMAVDPSFKWRERSYEFLKTLSWDAVWENMNRHILAVLAESPGAALRVPLTQALGESVGA